MAQSQPNAAHLAVAALAELVPQLTVVTQNVDDLHERADSHDVIHLHGSLNKLRCFACSRPHYGAAPSCVSAPSSLEEPRRCLKCGGRVRPDVVWFGETLPKDEMRQAFRAAKECDLLISIGTSGVVYPAAALPGIARDSGATVIHINPDPVQALNDIYLQGLAGEWLPQLVAKAFQSC